MAGQGAGQQMRDLDAGEGLGESLDGWWGGETVASEEARVGGGWGR